jgi:FkbM family methyltransferase
LIDSDIYFDGVFESTTSRRTLELTRPGDVVLDIGANIGWHTVLLAKHVGTLGRVYAFEPTEYGYGRLRENLALNGLTNVVAERLALSDRCEDDAGYEFRAEWSVDGKETGKERGRVRYITLDRYVMSHQIAHIDLIKLDVDGWESKIIAGAHDVISLQTPALVIELGDPWLRDAGSSIEELVRQLTPFYRFYSEGDLREIPNVITQVKSLSDRRTLNAICVPKNRSIDNYLHR